MTTLILRAVKGSPLTNQEIDNNFAGLDNEKIQLGGDIGGTTGAPVVISLRGRTFSSASPTTGQAIVWNGSAWIPQTLATGSSVATKVLNDIYPQFNKKKKIFTLKSGATAITEGIDYRDNKDLTVQIGGRHYNAAVPQTTTLGPWIVDYTAEKTYTYRIAGSRIIFYRPIANRQTAEIRINNVSATRQKRSRYPFTPNTIAFGD